MKLLITGMGRSGTKWLATYLAACGYNCGHESDYFGGQGWRGRGLNAARDMGAGQLPDWAAVKEHLAGAPADWIEVNGYLQLHVAALVAARVPVLHLVRDGRDQVRSVLARKPRPAVTLRQFRPPAGLSYFGKVAFSWAARTLYLRSFRVLRFEDMLADFDILAAALQPYGLAANRATWERLRGEHINETPQHLLPAWPEWTTAQRAEFDAVATEAMTVYGYYPA
jgi:hypothetical protein